MSMKRELRLMNKGMRRLQSRNGEGVLWYEYAGVQADNYLLEGTKRYLTPIAVPCLWIIESEDPEMGTPEGRRLTPTIRGAVPYETLVKSGLSDPQDSERHLNDILQYGKTLYSIGSYERKGRMGREDVIVGFNAIKVFPDEDLVFDTLPPGIAANETRRPEPVIEDDTSWQIFPDHELPARQT